MGYPVIISDSVAVEPRYFGSVAYYAAVAACADARIAKGLLYDKRAKQIHRTSVVDTNGSVTLTLPVGKPHGIPRATWADVPLSAHGNWWHVHLVTLESAYSRTPFFEFYIDRLLPYLCADTVEAFTSVQAYLTSLDVLIRSILSITTPAELTCPPSSGLSRLSPASASADMADESGHHPSAISPAFAALERDMASLAAEPYYQLRASRLGFCPNQSVLDLIFSLGPEAPLYLSSLISSHTASSTCCSVSSRHDEPSVKL